MSYHPAKFGGHSHSGSGVIRNLVCHVILQDHMIKGSCDSMGMESLMACHNPAKFGDHRHHGGGDIMFFVAEEKNSRCCRFNPPLLFNPSLLFICKGHGLKAYDIYY